MEAAAVASSGTGLRCSLNAVPRQQRRSARVGVKTKRQPCAVTSRRLLLCPNARLHRAASASVSLDSGAGNSGVSRKGLAVFVSGGGSNFRSIHEAALGGEVNGDVVALITDKPGCGGAEYARCNGIPVIVSPKSKSAPEGVSTDGLLNVLRDLKVDFVLLAGYLKLIPGELVQAYPRSMLNIHPSLLPAFGGKGYYGSRNEFHQWQAFQFSCQQPMPKPIERVTVRTGNNPY
uniref:Uncharacterized protein n=1 Tax=Avena sativa TaxID=4498 RepID=A0ACD5TFI3_AVESA